MHTIIYIGYALALALALYGLGMALFGYEGMKGMKLYSGYIDCSNRSHEECRSFPMNRHPCDPVPEPVDPIAHRDFRLTVHPLGSCATSGFPLHRNLHYDH